jgi:membrane-bound lytic murein transglycosylase D
MLGGNHIRTGAFVALLSAALFGCTVPVPFVQNTPHPGPQVEPLTLPEEPDTPAPAREVVSNVEEPVQGPDLWRKIGDGLTLHKTPHHFPRHPLKKVQYAKSVIENGAVQSRPYLHFVVSELDKRKLPYELALIPLLESGFNPAAGSRGGPAGLWQLIPSTGQRFGLEQTSWYDGRRDVVASTDAALHYFEQLRDHFNGDWLLAIAAYNCGERTVQQAVARNRDRGRATDFWSLSLPGGTRAYVERLINVAALVAEPAAFGIKPVEIPNRPYFDVADVGINLPLSRIAGASGLSAKELLTINPAFVRQTTVAGATRVLVAHGHGDDVVLALSSLSDEVRRLPDVRSEVAQAAPSRAGQRQHTVRAGDSLSLIAARAGVSVRALREVNHLGSTKLRLGQVLRLPDSAKRVADAKVGKAQDGKAPRVAVKSAPAVHVVSNGDNLWDIAKRHHVSAEALAQANGLTARSVLKLGQKLRLPSVAARGELPGVSLANADTADEPRYQVREGDSLWTISRRFNVSVDALKKWNRLSTDTTPLQPGQRLVINGET